MPADRVILVAGTPGAGKTGFARWLARQGWAMIEDDRVIVEPATSQLVARWLFFREFRDLDGLMAQVAEEKARS